ncbi:MAG: hypothetical protein IJJ33_06630 [Victivallales bacterium]|nr:hypothetical protein [Victivallales bacterium]
MKGILTIIAIVAATFFSAASNLPELYFEPPARIAELGQETVTLIANGKSNLEIVIPNDSGDVLQYAGRNCRGSSKRRQERKFR